MRDHSSIRAIEYTIEKQAKETEGINKELGKLENEKVHLEVLNAAVNEWVGLLKGVQRLSKGVPVMRSIRKVICSLGT